MMHQTFRGRTLDEAKRAALATLGEGAVIVATRRVHKTGLAGMFGGEEIEIAATPAEPAAPTRMSRMPPAAGRPSRHSMSSEIFSEGVYRASEESSSGSIAPPAADLEAIKQLRTEIKSELRAVRLAASRPNAPAVPKELMNELASMRSMLDSITSPTAAPQAGSTLARILEARGIEGPVVATIARKIGEGEVDVDVDLRERLRDAISDEIRVMPWPVAHDGPAIVAMVGPAGVGKTTTCAKMAAHAIAQGKTVTLVGADVFRVGAAQQLQRYAELLGARFVIASTAGELSRIVARDMSDLIIVDTSGQAVPEPNAPEGFLQRSVDGEGIEGRARYVLLCVPASLRAADARRIAGRYGAVAPTGIVVTKIDETDAPAGLLHISHATRLPTCALCFGPQVPDAIASATRGAILDHLVPLARKQETGR